MIEGSGELRTLATLAMSYPADFELFEARECTWASLSPDASPVRLVCPRGECDSELIIRRAENIPAANLRCACSSPPDCFLVLWFEFSDDLYNSGQ